MYEREERYIFNKKSPGLKQKRITQATVACAILLCLGGFVLTQCAGANAIATMSDNGFQSTPRDQWREGVMPTLYQKDPEWSDHPYGSLSFGEGGCGPISLAMVYVFLTGDTGVSPTDIADMAVRQGYASEDGTSWSFMVEGAEALGMQCAWATLEESLVAGHLAEGSPLICVMGPGDFTTTGHFIVITGMDDAGNLIIRDSNSVERTAQVWPFETIRQQCRAAWVYWV